MNAKEFSELVHGEVSFHLPFISAQKVLERNQHSRSVAGPELMAIGLLYPVTIYIFKRIGLPWLNAAVTLSNAELAKFHQWVKVKYEPFGFEPEQIEAAADAVYDGFTKVKSPIDQKRWEALRDEVLSGTHEDEM